MSLRTGAPLMESFTVRGPGAGGRSSPASSPPIAVRRARIPFDFWMIFAEARFQEFGLLVLHAPNLLDLYRLGIIGSTIQSAECEYHNCRKKGERLHSRLE